MKASRKELMESGRATRLGMLVMDPVYTRSRQISRRMND